MSAYHRLPRTVAGDQLRGGVCLHLVTDEAAFRAAVLRPQDKEKTP